MRKTIVTIFGVLCWLALFCVGSVFAQGRPFITTWKTSRVENLIIPIRGKFRVVIKKGDEVISNEVVNNTSGTSPIAFRAEANVVYTLEVDPEGVRYINMGLGIASRHAFVSVEQFGDVKWTQMNNAFARCEQLQFSPTCDAPDLILVNDMDYMFSGCEAFNSNIEEWDVSKVASMKGMFSGCKAFNQPLAKWGEKLGKVTDMQYMFNNCERYAQSLASWKTPKVENMRNMFYGCKQFNCDLSGWDVSKVTSMADMFSGASAFDQNLGAWQLTLAVPDLDGTALTPANYDATLKGWSEKSTVTNKSIKVTGLVYTEAGKAHREALQGKNWTFVGDALDSETITLFPKHVTCSLNRTTTLTLGKGSALGTTPVTFEGENDVIEKVAETTEGGEITIKGKQVGKIVLKATCGTKVATCNVEVKEIKVTSIAFAPTALTHYVGDGDVTLTPTILPDNASNPELDWESDKEEVATVTNGVVKIKGEGTAKITAKSTDGSNKSGEVILTVKYRVDGVKILKDDQEISTLKVTEGQAFTLKAKVEPEATPGGVTWQFDNTQFNAMEQTAEQATFTPLAVGASFTITAVANKDTDVKGQVTVTVLPKVSGIEIYEKGQSEPVGASVSLTVGESKEFEVKQLPEAALPLDVVWSATVSGQPADGVTVEGGKVTATKKVEGCTITASVKVSDTETKSKSFTLVITDPAPVAPTGMTLSATTLSVVEEGEGKEVTINFQGTGTIDEGYTVTPETSEYITIVKDGKKLTITGKKPTLENEPVAVTVTSTKNTTLSQTCNVTVTKKEGQGGGETVAPTGMTLTPATLSVEAEGDGKEVTITFQGTGNIDEGYTVTPDDTNEYISITKDGKKLTIKGKKPTPENKPVAVTVTSTKNTTLSQTCNVTVTKKEGQGGGETVAPTGMTLSATTLSVEAEGDGKEVTITFEGTGNIDDGYTVTPETSEYITIVKDGKKLTITGKKPTPANEPVEVTVTSTKNPTLSQTCKVTVTKKAEEGGEEDTTTFAVELAQTGNGTLTIQNHDATSLKKVKKGTELTVVATPDPNWSLTSLTAGKVDILATKKFTVNANIKVVATFTKTSEEAPNTSVEDAVFAALTVTPNPFFGQLRLANPAGITARYELVTLSGVVVRSGALAEHELFVETETLPSGIYFVRFYGANSAQKTVRVVKY